MQTEKQYLSPSIARSPAVRQSRVQSKKIVQTTVAYLVLLVGTVIFMIPFLWMLTSSLKSLAEVQTWPIIWFPSEYLWGNYLEVFERTPFARYLFNSTLIAVGTIIGTVVGSSLAGFGFARLRFPGRDVLFFVNLTTLMLPAWVVIVPHFMMFSAVGWLDTYLPMIVPAFFGNPFHIFLFRQYFLGIPQELEDAAQIDGAPIWRIFLQIFMPMSKPVIATVAIFTFYSAWNDLIYPLVYLQSQLKFPVSLGLRMFQTSNAVIDIPLMMAASVMALLPCVLLFLFAQRLFMQGAVITGVDK